MTLLVQIVARLAPRVVRFSWLWRLRGRRVIPIPDPLALV